MTIETINIPNSADTAGIAGSGVFAVAPAAILVTGDFPALVAEVEAVGASTELPARAVVGRDTSTGVIKLCDPEASDGSENPIGITVNAVATGIGETAEVEVYVAGVFNPDALVWHENFANDAQKRLAFKVAAPMIFLRRPKTAD